MMMLVSGAIVMGFWVCGLFFLRFWRRTADRLFAIFAAAFWLLGLQRLALATHAEWNGENARLYLLRLLAFAMVLAAVIDKNRRYRTAENADGMKADS
jgi:hypothetical protein